MMESHKLIRAIIPKADVMQSELETSIAKSIADGEAAEI